VSESFTSYTVDNDKRFRNALKRAAEFSTDFRIPFGLILRDFYKSEQAIFKLKGPGKYPPFKKSVGEYKQTGKKRAFETAAYSAYQKYKLGKFGFDYPLLVATGKLAASLLGPNNPGSIANVTNLSLVFGTSVEYGIYHQSDEPRSKIPLRKFLFIGPEAPTFATSEQQGRLERWLYIMQDHLNRSIEGAGL